MSPRARKPPPTGPCANCDHQIPHNRWGKCAEPGCDCAVPAFPEPPEGHTPELEAQAAEVAAADPASPKAGAGKVLVFRNPHDERPVAVPDEIVSVADRCYRAYLLRRRGKSWTEIALTEQWPTPAAAAAEVQRYLDEGKAIVGELRRRELLAFEVDRLDALMDAVWAPAMEGKVQAVMAARTLIMDRVKVLQLDQGSDTGADGAAPTTVVVLGGSEDQFIAGLQAVVGDDTALLEAPEPPAGPDG